MDTNTDKMTNVGTSAQTHVSRRLVLMCLALFLTVPLLGMLIVWLESPRLERTAYQELTSIAQLKVKQINNWIDERIGDGSTLANDAVFISLAADLIETRHASARVAVENRLKAYQGAFNYEAISIVDNHNEPVIQVTSDKIGSDATLHPIPPELSGLNHPPDFRTLAITSISGHASNASMYYFLAEGTLHVAFAFQLQFSAYDTEPFATLVLDISPDQFLYPYITSWPTASKSGETLLVKQSGDNVIFLTPLRHQEGEPGTLTHNLDDPELPAAFALHRGGNGTFEGMDYNGTHVLTAYHAIANTDWQLIAKIDRAEVITPLYRLLYWVCFVTLVAVAIISRLLVNLLRKQQHLHALTVEQERHKSDKLLRQFYDMPFIGIAITSAQRKQLLRFNDRLCDIFGYSRDELTKLGWAELVHPDDLDADAEELARVMRNESDGYSMDKRFLSKDGTLVYAYVDTKCVRNTEGGIEYFVTMIQDITERKQTELALQNTRQRAQSYLDIAGVMMIALDTDAHIQMVNRRACEILGYREDEIKGRNWFELSLPESEREFVAGVFSKLMTGEVDPVEYVENRIITRAGHKRLIAWHNVLLYDEHGAITGALSSGSDITNERAAQLAQTSSEIRLRTLVQTIPDLVWLKDRDGVYLACNTAFERLYGASESEIIGKSDYDFVDKDTADFFRNHDRKAMERGKPSTNEEVLNFASDDYQGIFETTKTPMYDSHGEIIGVLGIAHDITERKRAESNIENLSKLYATLSQTNQSIVRCKNEQEMFDQVCSNAVNYGQYKMAWIGLLDENARDIVKTAAYGNETDYLDHIQLSADPESPYAQGPVSLSIRTGQPVWIQDFMHDNNTAPWHELAEKAGFAAAASLPLRRGGKIIGCFTLYDSKINAFDEQSRDLLTEMAMDISFALDNFELEKQRSEIQQQLSLIIQGSNDAPWDWNLVSDELYYSPQWWKMIGYKTGELPDDSSLWRRLAHPDDLEKVEDTLKRILKSGHERDVVECRLRHKDGHYVPVLVRGIVSRNEAGTPVRLTGTTMDLTKQKETERELREQLEELNRWFKATVGREERIIDLKREVNAMLKQHQLPPRYLVETDDNSASGFDAKQ